MLKERERWTLGNERMKKEKKGCEEKGSNFGKGKEKDFSKMRVGYDRIGPKRP